MSTTPAQELHFDAIVIDGHCDSIGEQLDQGRWLGERSSKGHIDLPRLRDGGVTAQFFACYVPIAFQRHGATVQALDRLDQLLRLADQLPGELVLARRAGDIRLAKTENKVAAIAGLEGAEALDGSIGVLRQFYRLGVRNLGLAWNYRNAACDGVSESRSNGGLTQFGVKVVEECNRLGMLIDLSHLSPAGVDDVLNTSLQPVIASHSNARALCDHPRNLTDAQMEAIAVRGGVVGVTFVDAFLNARNPSRATMEDVIAHIEYMLARIGPDAVAIGSDFDGCNTPADLPDVTAYPRLTARLLDRGHSPAVVRKVLGGNLLRVFSSVCGE